MRIHFRAACILLFVGFACATLLAQARRRGRGTPPAPASAPAGAPADAPRPPPEKSPAELAEASLRTLHGHQDGVLALAFSPDGSTLASASADNSIILWNLADGSILKKLQGHLRPVASVAFSADGSKLVSGGMDGGVNVWDVKTGQIEFRENFTTPAIFVTFTGDNQHLAEAWGKNLFFFDSAGGPPRQVRADDNIASLLVTPKGDLITGDQKATIVLWNPKTGERTAQFARPVANHFGSPDTGPNWIMGMTRLADGRILLCDMTGFWLWDTSAGTFTCIGKGLYHVAAAFDHDRFYCGGADDGTLWFRDMHPDGVSLLIGEPFPIHAIAASPNGDWLAVAGGGKSEGSDWRTAGPIDIRLLKIDDIVRAMDAQKTLSLAKLAAARPTNPAAVIDDSAINPAQGQPLPWKKVK